MGDAGGYIYRVDSNDRQLSPHRVELDFGTGIVQGSPDCGFHVRARLCVRVKRWFGRAAPTATRTCSAVYQLTHDFSAGDCGIGSDSGQPAVLRVHYEPESAVRLATSTLHTRIQPTPPAISTFAAIPVAHPNPVPGSRFVAGAFPSSGNGTSVARLLRHCRFRICSPVTDVLNPNATADPRKSLRERGNQWFEPRLWWRRLPL